MTTEMTYNEYQEKIRLTAACIIEEATEQCDSTDADDIRDYIYDNGLDHKAVDGHQWIICTAYHDDIVRHTSNENAYLDIYSYEDLGRVVAEKGLDELNRIRAFYAMSQDVREAIDEALANIEDN